MMIRQVQWKNLNAVCMENDCLQIVFLPELGGKIASFYHKPAGFEVAARYHGSEYRLPEIDADFSAYDLSGMDDAFPSIDPSSEPVHGKWISYPDHGEIWSKRLQYLTDGEKLVFACRSERFPYHYEKQYSLRAESLTAEYRITNTGQEDFPCIWAFHGLCHYEPDMEVFCPDGIRRFRNVLKEKGTVKGNAFSRITLPPPYSMAKYYADGEVWEGRCGFRYPSQQMNFSLSYDAGKLPYLGVWMTSGGFHGRYHCALEPANGFYDSVPTARENDALYYLKAGEPLAFTLNMTLSRAVKN